MSKENCQQPDKEYSTECLPKINYVVANCGFETLEEAEYFQYKMGFPDWVCSWY